MNKNMTTTELKSLALEICTTDDHKIIDGEAAYLQWLLIVTDDELPMTMTSKYVLIAWICWALEEDQEEVFLTLVSDLYSGREYDDER